MEKIFEFDLLSMLISALYFGLIIYLLIVLLSYDNKVKKNAILSLVLAVCIYYGFFLLNHLISFKSIPPDSIFYANIVNDYWNNYAIWTSGVKLYAIINFIPFQFSLKYPVIFILFNIFFFYCGIIFIGKSFMRLMYYYKKPYSENFMAHLLLYTCIYPAGIIIIPTLLREGTMIFFLGLSTFMLIDLYTNRTEKKGIRILVFSISLILLTLIRPIGGVSYMIAIFVFYLYHLWNKGFLKFLISGLGAMLVLIILTNYIADSFYNISFSFSWLEKFRASHAEVFGSEAYGTQLNWTGHLAQIKSSFLLFIQYAFSPFPIIIPSEITQQKIIPTLDACFILLSMIMIFFYLKVKPIKVIVIFSFILLFIPALFETHISGAYRHRMNAIVMLLPVFSYSLNSAIIKLNRKK